MGSFLIAGVGTYTGNNAVFIGVDLRLFLMRWRLKLLCDVNDFVDTGAILYKHVLGLLALGGNVG